MCKCRENNASWNRGYIDRTYIVVLVQCDSSAKVIPLFKKKERKKREKQRGKKSGPLNTWVPLSEFSGFVLAITTGSVCEPNHKTSPSPPSRSVITIKQGQIPSRLPDAGFPGEAAWSIFWSVTSPADMFWFRQRGERKAGGKTPLFDHDNNNSRLPSSSEPQCKSTVNSAWEWEGVGGVWEGECESRFVGWGLKSWGRNKVEQWQTSNGKKNQGKKLSVTVFESWGFSFHMFPNLNEEAYSCVDVETCTRHQCNLSLSVVPHVNHRPIHSALMRTDQLIAKRK